MKWTLKDQATLKSGQGKFRSQVYLVSIVQLFVSSPDESFSFAPYLFVARREVTSQVV